jgi:hypothetical protein
LCLPRGPHSASTSALIHAPITCRPVATASASRPSRADSAISVNATVAASNGGTTASVLVAAVFFC